MFRYHLFRFIMQIVRLLLLARVRVVGRDRLRDVGEEDGLAGPRRGDDEPALPHADGGEHVHDARRQRGGRRLRHFRRSVERDVFDRQLIAPIQIEPDGSGHEALHALQPIVAAEASVFGALEESNGVERMVASEDERVPAEAVGAALRHEGEVAAAIPAGRRVVETRLQLHFLKRFRRGRDVAR